VNRSEIDREQEVLADSRGRSELSLAEYWDIVWQGRMLVITISGLAAVVSVAIALLSTPVFRAEATLAPVISENSRTSLPASLAGQLSSLSAVPGLGAGGSDKIEIAKATLRSRAFTEKFIQEQNLLPILFEKQWDENTNDWKSGEEGATSSPTAWQSFRVFSGMLEIREDIQTGLLNLSISWKDPVQAAEWINSLVRSINNHMRNRDVEEAEKSVEYLTNQVSRTGVVQMQQVLYNLIEMQTRTIMLASVRNEYVFRTIDPAVVPETRIKPKRKQIVFVGLSIGLIVSLAVIFLQHIIISNRRKYSPI